MNPLQALFPEKRPAKKLPFSEALRSDFPASIIVFLVALPLCMGIAIASGAPPATGLITGIVGGLVVGLIAGSPLQVSGPAAGLFVLVFDVIDEHGLAALGVVVLGAGIIQLVAGLMRLGSWFRAVSPAVIQGMLSGIGVLILASQFHVMVDDKNAAAGYVDTWGKGIANLITIPQSLKLGIVPLDGSPHHLAAGIGVGTILILAFWKFVPSKKLRIIPAPVVAVVAASAVAYALGLTAMSYPTTTASKQAAENGAQAEQTDGAADGAADEGKAKNDETEIKQANVPADSPLGKPVDNLVKNMVQIQQVRVPSNLAEGITLPTKESLSGIFNPAILVMAITIALVASAETMLCATAVDSMQTHAKTNYNRELAAQGVGNMICGVLGVLPMTGVIVRSSANVDAGGRTRISAFLHGVWLLLFVAALPQVLNLIPMASLAAVLVFTGWRLINWQAIRKLFKASYAEGIICLITLSLVVGVDLLTGVLVGIACAAAWLLYTFSRIHVDVQEDQQAGKTLLHLRGAATFLAIPKLTAILDDIDPGTELHVQLENLTYVDHACLELFVNWEKQHQASGGRLVMDWEDLTATFRSARPRNGLSPSAVSSTTASEQPAASEP